MLYHDVYSNVHPQMSTPDDPVIHSPPSLGGQLMNGFNPNLTPAKMEEGMAAACASPDVGGIDPNSDGEARRRQKTCRVCGDHATGYNFQCYYMRIL
ncbi:Nuclear hormone receptor member daf-12 [Parelaphostrongylus tenuis]|uniref:Nuclear hormone receptor member daf-12 n=1 Tax=Parelaphostrongylus tenuis TaxID=148309 RepID=A0AAD5QFS7_PARTN|nr:Nuclear hormone receptor member daf-12 [Parelaphostrongylus tenuis]